MKGTQTGPKPNITNIIKMTLDVVMTGLFIFLMRINFTGLERHEIIGLGLFALFIVHSLLNVKWIACVGKNLFKPSLTGKSKAMVAINLLLTLSVSLIMISGIIISPTLMPQTAAEIRSAWSDTHHFAAYTSLLLIAVHIGLHWPMIIGAFRRVFRLRDESGIRTWVSRAFSLAIAVIGLKAMMNPVIQGNFTGPFITGADAAGARVSQKVSSAGNASASLASAAGTAVETPTLEDYLSKLVCSGCSRRCPLTNLQCVKGTSYKTQAVSQYNALYANKTSSDNAIKDEENTEQAPASENRNAPTPIDYLGMMGLFIAGTHYTVTFTKKTREN